MLMASSGMRSIPILTYAFVLEAGDGRTYRWRCVVQFHGVARKSTTVRASYEAKAWCSIQGLNSSLQYRYRWVTTNSSKHIENISSIIFLLCFQSKHGVSVFTAVLTPYNIFND